jgi:hypothetical protein
VTLLGISLCRCTSADWFSDAGRIILDAYTILAVSLTPWLWQVLTVHWFPAAGSWLDRRRAG